MADFTVDPALAQQYAALYKQLMALPRQGSDPAYWNAPGSGAGTQSPEAKAIAAKMNPLVTQMVSQLPPPPEGKGWELEPSTGQAKLVAKHGFLGDALRILAPELAVAGIGLATGAFAGGAAAAGGGGAGTFGTAGMAGAVAPGAALPAAAAALPGGLQLGQLAHTPLEIAGGTTSLPLATTAAGSSFLPAHLPAG
ncbi:MAG: hypothetical protein ACREMG_08950, partial [Gemmatimonadales bacterium]